MYRTAQIRGGATAPLSFAQEGLWLLGQVTPGALNLPTAIRVRGALATEALEQALNIVIGRHAALRTRFPVKDGAPAQQVVGVPPVAVSVVDLRCVPATERQACAERAVADASARSFDLERPPLVRAHVVRTGPLEHLVVMTLHHLVTDEASRQQVGDELTQLYEACGAGRPLAMPQPQAHYHEFAQWEREQLASAAAESHLAFWREELADLPPLLEVPPDHPRPPQRTYARASMSGSVPDEITGAVQAFARGQGVTSFHVLLAGFVLLLSRYSGGTDIAVAVPISSRPSARYEGVVGPFLNHVVIRVDCAGRRTFRTLVRDVRAKTVIALAHAEVPFEAVVQAIPFERDASYNPLVQVAFAHKRGLDADATAWTGAAISAVEMHAGPGFFDLTLAVTETARRLEYSVQYNPALHDRATIERLIDTWGRILDEKVRHPDSRIDDGDLLSDAERRRQVLESNDTAVAWPPPSCLHEAVAIAGARAPDRVAVSAGGNHLTYAGLVRRARAIGSRLRRVGVSAGSLVGLLMDRTVDVPAVMLGALQQGAAYVPLDAAVPHDRLARLVTSARPSVIVTTMAMRAHAEDLGVPLIVADGADGAAAADAAVEKSQAATAALTRPAHANDLCYVLYTSGTTGDPKGVAVTHAAVMNVLRDFERACGMTAADATLCVASLTSDISALELFLPLVTGGRLALAPAHTLANGPDLRARIAREAVSLVQAAPMTWRLLLATGWNAPAGLKVLCGTEPLTPELARELIHAAGHVWNCYGPTETTIWSSFDRLESPLEPVTIGRPMANTSLYVLDRALQAVPVGVLGELHIGGVGLARGYVGQPSLTAAAFRPDPFGGSGRRMYATGDLATARPDERIDCRGRRDHQVKLHGRRIELDAISHAMESHPLVQSGVAVVRECDTRGRVLVAYVTFRNRRAMTRDLLREHLALRLPSFTVPSAIVVLDALPSTRRAKLDRRALPPPEEEDFGGEAPFVAPRTASEHAIAGIWREVIGVSSPGVLDDFFALGGNSLLAARTLQLIHDRLAASVSMQAFFAGPTIGALAVLLDRAAGASPVGEMVPRVPRDAELVLASQQEAWWRIERATGNINPNNVHFSVRLAGPLHTRALDQAVEALTARHEGLRTAFALRGDAGVPVIHPPGTCRLGAAFVDLTNLGAGAQEHLLAALSAREQGRAFDLTRAPLWRVTLVRLAADSHVVLLAAQHMVCDAASTDVLTSELTRLYASYLSGAPAGLPPLKFQYVDFARWQQDWLASPAAASQLAYWHRQLSGPLPDLFPAADVPSGYQGHFGVRARMPWVISAEATAAARRVARESRCTLFATVTAGLKALLSARTGQRDVRLGTLVPNRDLPGADEVVGLFSNAVCLRTHVEPSMRFRELIRRVQRTTGEASAHQRVPFERVAASLGADASGSLVYQVLLIWLTMPLEPLEFKGLQPTTHRPEDDGVSMVMVRNTLDLRLELTETASELRGTITFNPARFSTGDMAAFAAALDDGLLSAETDARLTVDALGRLVDRPVTAVAVVA